MSVVDSLRASGVSVHSADGLPESGQLWVEAPANLSSAKFHSSASIGAYTYFGPGCQIYALGRIGRFCSIAPGVVMGGGNHPIDWLSTHPFQFSNSFDWWPDAQAIKPYRIDRSAELIASPPKIGNDVWIGGRAVITRGITIGDGAIIGAGAVVTRDVAPYEIVGGVPAKTLRFRFSPDIIERLMRLQWWDYSLPSMRGIAFDKIDLALDDLEKRKEAGALVKLNPQKVVVKGGKIAP